MAIRISGVSLKVEGADKLKSELGKANAAIKQNKAEMERLEAQYGKGSTDADYLKEREQLLSKQLQGQQAYTAALQKARDAYAAQDNATEEGLAKFDLQITKSQALEAGYTRQIRECTAAMEAQAEVELPPVEVEVKETKQFEEDLAAADRAIEKNRAELEKLNAEYGKDSKSPEYMKKKQELLDAQLAAQKARTEALRQARDAYAAQDNATAEGLARFDLQITKSEALEAGLTRQLQECTAATREQGKAAEKAAVDWEKTGQKLESAGRKMSLAVTAPIMGMGVAALKDMAELEDAMYNVATLPGVGVENIQKYTKEVLEASNASKTAAEDIAAAQYQAISSGVAAEKSARFAEKAAKAAKAGNADVATVVDGTTSILNAWGDAAGGVTHVLDAMTVAQNEGKTTIGEIAGSIGQLTGLAPQLGVSLDETLSAVAALTKNGVQTSTAINGLKAVMSNVIKPTAEASQTAKKLGLDFSAAALSAKGFTGFLADVMERSRGDTAVLAKLFGSVEGLNQVMLLGGAAAGDYSAILREMGNSAGAMEAAFDIRTSSKIERLRASLNSLRNSGVDMASALAPAMDSIENLISGGADFFATMDDEQQQNLVTLLGISAAVGPVTSGMGKLIKLGTTAKALFAGPAGWIALGTAGLVGLGAAIAGIDTPMEKLDKRLKGLTLGVNEASVEAITGAINQGIHAADKEHEVTVRIASEIEVGADKLDSSLADGKLTYQEYNDFSQWVKTYVTPDIQAATKEVNAQKKAFYDSLRGQTGEDGKPLTDKEKKELAEAEVAPMQAMVDNLSDAKTELDQLMRSVYQQGGTATEEEIARMNELLGLIQQYRIDLELSQDATWQAMEDTLTVQKAGKGTDATLGTSIGYVNARYETRLADLENDMAEQEALYTAAAAEALAAGESTLDAEKAFEKTSEELTEAKRQEREKMIADLNAIFEGEMKQAPGSEAGLTAVGDLIDDMQALKNLIDSLNGWGPGDITGDMLPEFRGQMSDGLFSAIFGTDKASFGESNVFDTGGLKKLAEGYLGQLTTELETAVSENGAALSPVMTALQAMMDSGAMENLDLSDLSGGLSDAMRLYLVQEGGLDAIGGETMEQLGEGMKGNSAPQEAMQLTADDVLDVVGGMSARNAGKILGDTYGEGILDNVVDAVRAVRQFVGSVNAEFDQISYPTVPRWNFSGSTGGGAGGSLSSADLSTNVTIQHATIGNKSSVSALAKELNGLQKANAAGIGLFKR